MPERPPEEDRQAPSPGWIRVLSSPIEACLAGLDPIVSGEGRIRNGALLVVALVAAWYAYVPIHELLHALGCAATGGTVTTLEIQTQYGGGLLARIFPFVEPGGEYAGRLSNFDTHGSDLVYLATDALPYALSVGVGVPLLRAVGGRPRPLLLGPGLVLGLAPFYSLPGDYFEMGSIVVTAALGEHWHGLRSDDLFLLIGRLRTDPAGLGLAEVQPLGRWLVVASAGVVALGLAYGTWMLGELASRIRLPRKRPAQSRRSDPRS